MLRNFPPLLGHACLCAERLGGYETDKEWAEKLLSAIPRKNAICHKNRRPPSQRAVAHRDGGLLYADRFYAYDGYL